MGSSWEISRAAIRPVTSARTCSAEAGSEIGLEGFDPHHVPVQTGALGDGPGGHHHLDLFHLDLGPTLGGRAHGAQPANGHHAGHQGQDHGQDDVRQRLGFHEWPPPARGPAAPARIGNRFIL